MAESANTPDVKNEWDELPAGYGRTIDDHHVQSLHLDGDAIEKIGGLAARASGVDLKCFPAPDDWRGLPEDIPFGVRRTAAGSETIDLKPLAESWRLFPEHRRGVAKVGDVASFIDLVNRHKTANSVVFAQSDWRKPSLLAVIDYHSLAAEDAPDYGKHRVAYDFPFSDEWSVWLKHDGKAMDQVDFAEFIEERAPDMIALVEADSAHHARELQVARIGAPNEIFDLARGLEINVGGKVKQNVKLQSGEAQIAFEESHTGRDGTPIKVPGAFALSIPLFYGEDPITIPVRLRYRVVGGAIVWTYKLFRVDRLVAEAVKLAKDEVRNETALKVFEGAPEMMSDGRIVTGSTGG